MKLILQLLAIWVIVSIPASLVVARWIKLWSGDFES